MREPTYSDAILSLTPNAKFGIYGTTLDGLEWPEQSSSRPSNKDIEAELKKLKDEYDAQAYSRNRKVDYPDWGTQLNKIYDDGITKWKSEMVDPVKAKWPKDNSGPK